VQLAAVVDTSIASYITAAANLEPEKTAVVLAKVEGTVTEVLAEEGDDVTEGQVLARLDGSELRIEYERARIRAEAERAELERAASLFEKGLMSEKDYAAQKNAADLAESELEAARLKYSYTTIRAPYAGKITRRSVDVGQTVRVGSPLFTLEDTTPLLCKIHLPAHLVSSVKVGQPAEVTVSDEDRTIPARVRMISPVVDPATGTVKVTLELEGKAVRSGAFADVRMVADVHEHVLAVERKAVLSEGGEMYVFVAESDTVRKVPVTTGYEEGDLVEVTSGLSKGDSVVVVGHGGIEEGSRIKAVAPTRSAAGDSAGRPATAPADSVAVATAEGGGR